MMSRLPGQLEVTKPSPLTREAGSMGHATVATALLATPFAASLMTLTLRLLPAIAEIGQLIASFQADPLTPESCHRFETQLHRSLRELGRIIVEWTYNRTEPDDPALMPRRLDLDDDWYRRRGKTPNRRVATLFGTVTLWRHLYQPIHGAGRALFPLEIRLGLAARCATPALAERIAAAAVDSTQEALRVALRRDYAVALSVQSLRRVIAATCEAMAPHAHAAQVAQVLVYLGQAQASRGSRKPVPALGRDGVFVPIRGEDQYREAATATPSVYDRAGRRLGTVYLGQMPESGQGALSRRVTRLITDVLAQWTGPLPRLAYVTDAGHHPTEYYRGVLRRMRHPCRPAESLHWEWVLDYYHASGRIYELAAALYRDPGRARSWARKMCRWLKVKPHAIYRVLHSAAAIRSRRLVVGKSKAYRAAYNYLRDRMAQLDYVRYRRDHLPIGSGVTEAACRTVFARRLKRSGMSWGVEGGQWIVDLRVIQLSGVWDEVHRSYLREQILPDMRTQEGPGKKKGRKAA
jgi:hypothetical protein